MLQLSSCKEKIPFEETYFITRSTNPRLDAPRLNTIHIFGILNGDDT